LWINARQGIAREIIPRIEPGACEGFHRWARASAEGHCIDGELRDGRLFFGRLGFAVGGVKKSGAQLQEVNVAGDRVFADSRAE
jgi:hypothetical protein